MAVFDEMATRYDTAERAWVADIIAQKFRENLAGCEGKTAVDYGCGTGLVGLQLAGCFASLLMVDASAPMVEQVRHKIEKEHLKNVKTLYADFAADAPAGLSADVIFMAQVLLHIRDTEGILQKLHSLLRPNGRLLVVDFDKKESIQDDRVHNGFLQADLIGLAKRCGFQKVRAETFYRGKRMFMNQDASLFFLEAEK